ncbi:MAG: PDZ domain-containing protein, partial [Sediminibacterium sp.]
MKSKKGLLLVAIVMFAGLFFAFRSSLGATDPVLPPKQRLLSEVGRILTQLHYSPKDINDDFSKKVFKKYLDDLDGDKSHFLQSDINELRKYETLIDDEIHEKAVLAFAPTVSKIYDQRLKEVMAIYKEILSKPFDFTKDESVQLDGDKLGYVKSEAERKERWRKKLKYYVLERYVDEIQTREKNKDSAKFVVKKDSTIERESRERVLKMMNENYGRIQKTFKEDERFNSFINVITNQMDPHSDYFPPVEKRAFDERMSGKFYGIGATLGKDDYGIKITSVVTGGAAWKSGKVVVNDVITKVAQGAEAPVDVTGFDVTDAVKIIRGNKGTEVKLTIKKQDGSISV